MSEIKSNQSLQNLGKALKRLADALQESNANALIVDGTIQRFEFVIELYWKTLKRMLAEEGIVTHTPKEALQKAFHIHWLDEETIWLDMLRDRTQTPHVYDESMALKIYNRIRLYLPAMEKTYLLLLQKSQSEELNR